MVVDIMDKLHCRVSHGGCSAKREEADKPGLFNRSDLVVEVDELHQLLLQHLLSAHRLRDEAVYQQVQHVGAQLKVLDQTPVRRAQSDFGRFTPPKTA